MSNVLYNGIILQMKGNDEPMKKRQQQKNVQKKFQAMLKESGARTYDFASDHYARRAEISTDLLPILFQVMDNEFDDSPQNKWLSDHLLYKYAWWFVLEGYLTSKSISYRRIQQTDGLTYHFGDHSLTVSHNGLYALDAPNTIDLSMRLMLRLKGYKEKKE